MVAAAVLLVLIVGWQLLPGGGGEDPGATAGAAGSPTPSGQPSPSLAATPPSGDPGRQGSGGTVASAGAPTATTTTPTTPAPTTPAPTPTTPAPPRPCADAALALRVAPQRPDYRVGQTPVLDLEVRNTGTVACTRDLGAAQQEIVLYAGTRRLWSSNDCYPEGERDPQVLAPGAAQSFSVTWSGLSSQPRCAGERTRVGAGTYQLVGRLGTLVSRRATLVLT
jgi:hypothetical protein